MKSIKLLSSLIIMIGILYFILDQSRSFYKLEDGKAITVWKRMGGKCYVVPYTYYGISKPVDCYIETINTAGITLLWYHGKLIADIDSTAMIISGKGCEM